MKKRNFSRFPSFWFYLLYRSPSSLFWVSLETMAFICPKNENRNCVMLHKNLAVRPQFPFRFFTFHVIFTLFGKVRSPKCKSFYSHATNNRSGETPLAIGFMFGGQNKSDDFFSSRCVLFISSSDFVVIYEKQISSEKSVLFLWMKKEFYSIQWWFSVCYIH